MEQVGIGILMIVAFLAGAYVREPIKINKKEEDVKQKSVKVELDDETLEEMKRMKQYEALFNYSEKDALNVKGTHDETD